MNRLKLNVAFWHFYMKFIYTKRGFTLIELLVVIAIIGILSAVVLASLSTARQKSRDAKRIAEVTQIQKALDYYYDINQSYPSTTPTGYSGVDAGVQAVTAIGLLPKTPTPPPGTDTNYIYHGVYDNAGTATECDVVAPAGTPCSNYELGITLERRDNIVLTNDADQSIGTFYGAYPDCAANVAGADQCFDVKR